MVKCKVNIPVSWKHLGRFFGNMCFFPDFFLKEAGPARPVDDHHPQGSYQPVKEQIGDNALDIQTPSEEGNWTPKICLKHQTSGGILDVSGFGGVDSFRVLQHEDTQESMDGF